MSWWVTHICFSGYADYGDYWRANYEVDHPQEYQYQRAKLITDVENTFNQVRFDFKCFALLYWGKTIFMAIHKTAHMGVVVDE